MNRTTEQVNQACEQEGCKKPTFLSHKLCERHHREKQITDRWDGWIEANKGFECLDHLVIHPDDWHQLGSPSKYNGYHLKPLGIDCCMCTVCVIYRRQRGVDRTAEEGVR